jgi:methylmalonyl-CoA/ethylmalonyl-CoA epimerase
MFTQVDHIGFAVHNLEAAITFYSQAFGLREWERISLPDRHMAVAVTRLGETLLELIAPTSEEAAFAKFLREKGSGIHHIAYRVDDIVAALAELQSRGIPMVDREPRPGIHQTLVAFVHPKAGGQGVLTELVQHPH